MATFPPGGKTAGTAGGLNKTASVDELNFLAAQLQKLDAVELAELNAVMQSPAKMQTIGQLLDYAENTDCFVLINAKDNRSLGEYYLNDSGLFVVPDRGNRPLTPTGWEVLSPTRNREPLPITAISCEPATNGSASMRASQCRRNTG